MAHELSEDCIYTIVDGKELAAAAASGQAREFIEAKAWVTGQRLWQSATQAGLGMPVLFGDAAKGGPLLYWGILTMVAIDGGRTRYSVDRLRRIAGQRYPQDLTLKSSGKMIAPKFIRPYAICRTPGFLDARAV